MNEKDIQDVRTTGIVLLNFLRKNPDCKVEFTLNSYDNESIVISINKHPHYYNQAITPEELNYNRFPEILSLALFNANKMLTP